MDPRVDRHDGGSRAVTSRASRLSPYELLRQPRQPLVALALPLVDVPLQHGHHLAAQADEAAAAAQAAVAGALGDFEQVDYRQGGDEGADSRQRDFAVVVALADFE